MLIKARISQFTAAVKGKGEDSVRTGRIVIETDDLDEWQVELLTSALDGNKHTIGIDE